jgi:hypothetical protein
MFTLDQVLLACDDEMTHFIFDIIENPDFGLKNINARIAYSITDKTHR